MVTSALRVFGLASCCALALLLGAVPRATGFSVTPGGTMGYGTVKHTAGRTASARRRAAAVAAGRHPTPGRRGPRRARAHAHVVDQATGKPMASEVRTSTGTFFQRGDDDVIRRIEERVAAVTMIPVENQEGLQMLRYRDGQKYEPHADFFREKYNQDDIHGGQRIITVLMYLSTPEWGGETIFPNAEFASSGDDLSECAKKGPSTLANKPYKGDALMFYSLTPDGVEDEMSIHGSCPTLKGEKWSATKWIHVNAYGGTAAEQKAGWGDCVDANEDCGAWAKSGECKNNPGYMLVSCRKACGACKPKKGTPVIDVGAKT
ncbi:hypothetical protein MNEG_5728 [Monoraphidium neglectum]|uniref:Procollagen-proline 4-dioxygenase n=1 Tax=Monoraphidium neglectum TaxID=145388 RepID=A0A0D2JTK7_9CHLO|nr:hypothetical protein MNEG_5728 [Monoraphidium neglectum]KIZ02233.1 hypothetical protein MNEG_5728 [Monoraphidium neglectum]|eukprot:XP_013901252.1 hypothetical protein MNEG_5728 [Monoraphidium neglectum]